ncbi:MAG: GDP-mannose 4,6-dehydratase [Solirubrobacteraceae bacterium]
MFSRALEVCVQQSLVRASDPRILVGNPRRARELLGWQPTLGFEQLVRRMVDADLRMLRGE